MGLMYNALGPLLEAQHLQEMYIWLERLTKSPMSAEDPNLVPGTAHSKWHDLCKCILKTMI